MFDNKLYQISIYFQESFQLNCTFCILIIDFPAKQMLKKDYSITSLSAQDLQPQANNSYQEEECHPQQPHFETKQASLSLQQKPQTDISKEQINSKGKKKSQQLKSKANEIQQKGSPKNSRTQDKNKKLNQTEKTSTVNNLSCIHDRFMEHIEYFKKLSNQQLYNKDEDYKKTLDNFPKQGYNQVLNDKREVTLNKIEVNDRLQCIHLVFFDRKLDLLINDKLAQVYQERKKTPLAKLQPIKIMRQAHYSFYTQTSRCSEKIAWEMVLKKIKIVNNPELTITYQSNTGSGFLYKQNIFVCKYWKDKLDQIPPTLSASLQIIDELGKKPELISNNYGAPGVTLNYEDIALLNKHTGQIDNINYSSGQEKRRLQEWFGAEKKIQFLVQINQKNPNEHAYYQMKACLQLKAYFEIKAEFPFLVPVRYWGNKYQENSFYYTGGELVNYNQQSKRFQGVAVFWTPLEMDIPIRTNYQGRQLLFKYYGATQQQPTPECLLRVSSDEGCNNSNGVYSAEVVIKNKKTNGYETQLFLTDHELDQQSIIEEYKDFKNVFKTYICTYYGQFWIQFTKQQNGQFKLYHYRFVDHYNQSFPVGNSYVQQLLTQNIRKNVINSNYCYTYRKLQDSAQLYRVWQLKLQDGRFRQIAHQKFIYEHQISMYRRIFSQDLKISCRQGLQS